MKVVVLVEGRRRGSPNLAARCTLLRRARSGDVLDGRRRRDGAAAAAARRAPVRLAARLDARAARLVGRRQVDAHEHAARARVQDTGAVRAHDSRGKHTTTSRSLHRCPAARASSTRRACARCASDATRRRSRRASATSTRSRRDAASAIAPAASRAARCGEGVGPDRLRNYQKMLREMRRDTQTGSIARSRSRMEVTRQGGEGADAAEARRRCRMSLGALHVAASHARRPVRAVAGIDQSFNLACIRCPLRTAEAAQESYRGVRDHADSGARRSGTTVAARHLGCDRARCRRIRERDNQASKRYHKLRGGLHMQRTPITTALALAGMLGLATGRPSRPTPAAARTARPAPTPQRSPARRRMAADGRRPAPAPWAPTTGNVVRLARPGRTRVASHARRTWTRWAAVGTDGQGQPGPDTGRSQPHDRPGGDSNALPARPARARNPATSDPATKGSNNTFAGHDGRCGRKSAAAVLLAGHDRACIARLRVSSGRRNGSRESRRGRCPRGSGC